MSVVLRNDDWFKHLKNDEQHPTFAAEIEGVDFSKDISNDVFAEILAASERVIAMHMSLQPRVDCLT